MNEARQYFAKALNEAPTDYAASGKLRKRLLSDLDQIRDDLRALDITGMHGTYSKATREGDMMSVRRMTTALRGIENSVNIVHAMVKRNVD